MPTDAPETPDTAGTDEQDGAVAPDEQAVDNEIGDPLVPNSSATRSATVPNRKSS